MNLIFHNAYHNGDLHVTRNIIKFIIRRISNDYDKIIYKFSPKQHLNDLKDIERVTFTRNLFIPHEAESSLYHDQNGDKFINTWIGADGGVHHKGINLSSHLDMLTTLNDKLGIKLPKNELAVIPTIDYGCFKIKNAETFIKSNRRKRFILVCNGPALSTQCENFPMAKIINYLANNNNSMVIYTHEEPEIDIKSNTVCTNFINGFMGDLNEISYISTHCDIVIGRSSGPHTYSAVAENLLDANKLNISICRYYRDALVAEAASTNVVFHHDTAEEVLSEIIKYVG